MHRENREIFILADNIQLAQQEVRAPAEELQT